jgi:hypothetical protein
MGTHSLQVMRRKLHAFELFLAEGLFARTWLRDDFEVRVVASSEQQLQNITTMAQQVVDSNRWGSYLFADRDGPKRSRFADAEWRCLDGSTYGLLFSDASEASVGSRFQGTL